MYTLITLAIALSSPVHAPVKAPSHMTCGAPVALVQGSGTVRMCTIGGAS